MFCPPSPNNGTVQTQLTLHSPGIARLTTLEGEFDLIYIDAANDEYEDYTRFILDHKLLSRHGVILVDDSES